MAESTTLTLRAWPQRGSNEQPSISTLISRINAQEGAFRNAREDEQVEAEDSDAADLKESQNATPAEEEAEPKSQREKVLAAREEILKFGNQALTESSHTLDLISLVLTTHNPKQASFTLSPFIKQTLPNGCFGTEIVDPLKVSENQSNQNELASFGWKLQSLSTAADSLLRAASDLEQEMEKEAKYWDQVLSVKSKGWSVFRIPGPRRTLGARYGSLESLPEFRDKGVAALRRADDGRVKLDLGQNAVRGSLRVRVKSQGHFVASTQPPLAMEDTPEGALLQARNDLFDGELYHEMHREARALTNRGVRCVSEGIHIPLRQGVHLVVDTVEADEALSDITMTPDDILSSYPELTATTFRILLSYSHRQHYRNRTELPPPMKQRKKPRAQPIILQPVLLHLEHRESLTDIQVHLSALEKTLSVAKVPFKVGKLESGLKLKQLLETAEKESSNRFINELMGTLCSPLETKLLVETGYHGTVINMSIRTHLNGTEYFINHSTGPNEAPIGLMPHEAHFFDMPNMKSHISQLITIDLVSAVSTKYEKWDPSAPDEGELQTEPTMNGDMETLTLQLEPESLHVTWGATNELEGESRTVRWPQEGSETATKSFMEEVEMMNNIRSTVSGF